MRNWWHRKQIDHVWFLFAVLVVMFIIIFMQAVLSRAEGCLTITVPSGAVLNNYDGDTFELFTFTSPSSVRVRVLGVDTPEVKSRQPGSAEAKEFTRQWLAKGPFQLSTCGRRTFERIVGLVSRGDETLAQALIAAGHGVKALKTGTLPP